MKGHLYRDQESTSYNKGRNGFDMKNLFVPDKFMMRFMHGQVYFYSEEKHELKKAQAIVNGHSKFDEEYLGETEVPDEVVASFMQDQENVVQLDEALVEAKRKVNESGASLIKLVQE